MLSYVFFIVTVRPNPPKKLAQKLAQGNTQKLAREECLWPIYGVHYRGHIYGRPNIGGRL